MAKNDPGLFLEHYQPPLIIDEIQYTPSLLPYIKARVDKSKGKCSYWLTGSQHFHLMRGVSESLAGRVAVLKLLGFSYAEGKGYPYSNQPWLFESVAPYFIDKAHLLLYNQNMIEGKEKKVISERGSGIIKGFNI